MEFCLQQTHIFAIFRTPWKRGVEVNVIPLKQLTACVSLSPAMLHSGFLYENSVSFLVARL